MEESWWLISHESNSEMPWHWQACSSDTWHSRVGFKVLTPVVGYNAVGSQPNFQRNILPPSWGSTKRSSKKPALSSGCYLLHAVLLIYSSVLKMEATCSSETSVEFQRTTRRYIPEDTNSLPYACIRQVLCSNTRWDTDLPHWGFSWLSSIALPSFPSFTLSHLPVALSFDNMRASVVTHPIAN
jgi:hypothetical protein